MKKRKITKRMKQICGILLVGACLGVLAMVTDQTTGETEQIERNEPGEGSRQVEYTVVAQDQEEPYTLSLEVGERELSEVQSQQLLNDAAAELASGWLGENADEMHVYQSLVLPKKLQQGMVDVSYEVDQPAYVGSEGEIYTEQLGTEPQPITMTATLSYRGHERVETWYFCVIQKPLSQKEAEEKAILQAFQDAEQKDQKEKQIILPTQAAGKKITWKPVKEQPGLQIFGISSMLAAAVWMREEKNKKDQRMQREARLLRQYPLMVNQFSLLIGSGMSPVGAWRRMIELFEKNIDKIKNKDKHPMQDVYEEMKITLQEIDHGMSQRIAFETFGKRIGSVPYRRFGMLLSQNLSKGTAGLGTLLAQEADQMFEERKRSAQKAGEEAGTKLLFPMLLMLVLVIVVIMVPAFLTM